MDMETAKKSGKQSYQSRKRKYDEYKHSNKGNN